MQFITSGNRIAVENFVLGDLYTITFTNGTYINSACIGIGENFVSFQRNEPELLFSLTMATAELVSSIDLYAGGTGTNNYNDLTNKPQINDVELVGNKSLSDLGIQPTISDIDTIRSGAAAGATAVQPAALSDYQPIISDLDTIRSGAAAGATAVQPAALADYQPAIDSSHKLDADLVDDTSSTHKFATAAQLSQIGINENNISSQQNTVAQGGNGYALINGKRLYMNDTAPSGTIPIGSALVSNGKVWGYKNSTSANPTILTDDSGISDYTIKGNTEQNGTPTPSAPIEVNGVGTLESGNYVIPVTSGGTIINIPIGTVQTNRVIKKIVFDGTENEWRITGSGRMAYPLTGLPQRLTIPLCSHFIGCTAESYGNINNGECSISVTNQTVREFGLYDSSITTLADFKTWLQQQYANGTPLKVWYVLVTPETATVNEPLQKIGTYTDSITGAQSQLLIPTIAGENTITFVTTVQPSEFDITAWV